MADQYQFDDRTRWILIPRVLFVMVMMIVAPAFADEPRYQAKWTDGTLSNGNGIFDWTDDGRRARLDNQPLFSANRSIRWLRDLTQDITESQLAACFFLGGDCLPGTVIDYCTEDELEFDGEPHLRIEPGIPTELPGAERFRPLRILTDSLERIVWTSGPKRPLHPSTAYLKDGKQFEYRGMRWKKDGVQFLLSDRSLFVRFHEFSELQFPQHDHWKFLARRSAKLTPSLNSKLMQIHGRGGLCVTSSLERCSMRTINGGANASNWAQFIQPVWSLDPLVIRHSEISLRTFFRPNELPLTWLVPAASRHQGMFSNGWAQHQVDRNVQGGPLRNNSQFFAWGIGVHACHDLVYDLPEGVESIQTTVGIDEIAGNGGSARGRIFVDGRDDSASFESPILVGSQSQKVSGVVDLKLPRGKSSKIHLFADDAATDSPAWADPFDIRDIFDWLEPIIACDPQWMRRQINSTMDSIIPGWTIDERYESDWRAENIVDTNERPLPACRTAIIPSGELTMSRRVKVRAGLEQMKIVVGQTSLDGQHVLLSLYLNRRPLATVPISGWQSPQGYRPVMLDLSEYVGREVDIELRLNSQKPGTPIIWCGSTWQAKSDETIAEAPK